MKKEEKNLLHQAIVETDSFKDMDSKIQIDTLVKCESITSLLENEDKQLYVESVEKEADPKFMEIGYCGNKVTIMALLYNNYLYGEVKKDTICKGFDNDACFTTPIRLTKSDVISEKRMTDFKISNEVSFSKAALFIDSRDDFDGLYLEDDDFEGPENFKKSKILEDCLNRTICKSLIESAREEYHKYSTLIYLYENCFERFEDIVFNEGFVSFNFERPCYIELLLRKTYPFFMNWVYNYTEKHGSDSLNNSASEWLSEIISTTAQDFDGDIEYIQYRDGVIVDIQSSIDFYYDLMESIEIIFPSTSIDDLKKIVEKRFY